MVVLQADVTGGGPLALLVTFLLTALFYGATLHLAAMFFLGDVPSQRAAYVAPVPAFVSILFGQTTTALMIAITFASDLLAISVVYRLRLRTAVVLALLHLAFAAALGLSLLNLFGLA